MSLLGRLILTSGFVAAAALILLGVGAMSASGVASHIARLGLLSPFLGSAGLVLGVAFAALVLIRRLAERERALAESEARLSDLARERRRVEEALLQSQKLEAVGRLTGGMAHDFNNLLAAMASGLRLLGSSDDPAQRASVMEGMRQAIDRGGRLTRQVLALSVRRPIHPQAVLLGQQIKGMRELLERTLREDILLVLDLPDDLWPVEADPGQLELAVINLAVNARDAMAEGGTLTIRAGNVVRGRAGDAVRVSVRDTGVGMSAEARARAFEPFFTTKELGKGTGLGLAQVQALAAAAGGTVEIESGPGQGAEVILTLPRARPAAAPAHVSDVGPAAARSRNEVDPRSVDCVRG